MDTMKNLFTGKMKYVMIGGVFLVVILAFAFRSRSGSSSVSATDPLVIGGSGGGMSGGGLTSADVDSIVGSKLGTALEQQSTSFNKALSDQQASYENMFGQMNDMYLSTVNSFNDALADQRSEYSSSITNLQGMFTDQMGAMQQSYENQFSNLSNTFTNQLDAMSRNYDTRFDQQAMLWQGNLDQLNNALLESNQRFDQLAYQMGEQRNYFDGIYQQQQQTFDRLYNQQQSQFDSIVGQWSSQFDGYNQQLNNLAQNMTNQYNQQNQMLNDLRNNQSGYDALIRQLTQNQGSYQDQLSGYQSQINALQKLLYEQQQKQQQTTAPSNVGSGGGSKSNIPSNPSPSQTVSGAGGSIANNQSVLQAQYDAIKNQVNQAWATNQPFGDLEKQMYELEKKLKAA